MLTEWNLILFCVSCVVANVYSYILKEPSYSPDFLYFSNEQQKNDLRRTFLDKRIQNRANEKRVELIDQYLSNNSVFVDEVMHTKVDDSHPHLALVKDFETAFKNVISMNGVKFTFKRDPYWRTWRKVQFPDGDRIVSYRCERRFNCTDCNYRGHWVIEEKPPCPFEIVSVIDNIEVCAINITNNTNINKPCPSVVPFTDILSKCDNPIETKWRLQKVYERKVSERYPAILCGWRDYCEISTFYLITPKHVLFRIINSTNHILYSKIMRNNRSDYACVINCGVIDPQTKTVSNTGKPLVVDLINSKNKREDTTRNETTETVTSRVKQGNKTNMNKLKQIINSMETLFNLPITSNRRSDNENASNNQYYHHPNQTNDIVLYHHHHDEKNPTCSSMKHLKDDHVSEEILNDFDY